MAKNDERQAGRRDFLKMASLGVVAGGAALAVAGRDGEAEAEEAPAGGKGYRESAHVKAFYESARF